MSSLGRKGDPEIEVGLGMFRRKPDRLSEFRDRLGPAPRTAERDSEGITGRRRVGILLHRRSQGRARGVELSVSEQRQAPLQRRIRKGASCKQCQAEWQQPVRHRTDLPIGPDSTLAGLPGAPVRSRPQTTAFGLARSVRSLGSGGGRSWGRGRATAMRQGGVFRWAACAACGRSRASSRPAWRLPQCQRRLNPRR